MSILKYNSSYTAYNRIILDLNYHQGFVFHLVVAPKVLFLEYKESLYTSHCATYIVSSSFLMTVALR